MAGRGHRTYNTRARLGCSGLLAGPEAGYGVFCAVRSLVVVMMGDDVGDGGARADGGHGKEICRTTVKMRKKETNGKSN